MNLRPLIFFTFTCVLISCVNEFSEFKDNAISYATKDNNIDSIEYYNLIKHIKNSPKDFSQFCKGDSISHQTIRKYLIGFFKSQKLNIAEDDIYQPFTRDNNTKFNINIYIENSGSMDGYVKGKTEFENAIYNLLVDIKTGKDDFCKSLNLNYINTNFRPNKQDAFREDIADFIDRLEPESFKLKGGNRKESDISNIFSMVLDRVNKDTCCILISDCIFSPPSSVKDATNYLNTQEAALKAAFNDKLRSFDLAAWVLQMESDFNGTYYTSLNNKVPLKSKRPYYIWIIGSKEQLQRIKKSGVVDKIITDPAKGYKNQLVLAKNYGYSTIPYRVSNQYKKGKYTISKDNLKQIEDIEFEDTKTNKIGFGISANFKNGLLDMAYFADTAHYETLPAVSITSIKTYNKDNDYPTLLEVNSTKLKDGDININAVLKLDKWVDISNSLDDNNIANDTLEQQKTFGIKNLITGIFNSFEQYNNKKIATLKITLKQ